MLLIAGQFQDICYVEFRITRTKYPTWVNWIRERDAGTARFVVHESDQQLINPDFSPKVLEDMIWNSKFAIGQLHEWFCPSDSLPLSRP